MLPTTKLLTFLSLLLPAAHAAPTSPSDADYGSWAIQVTTGNAASGYRWGDLYAEHSSRPGVVSHSYWLYSPEFQNITFRPDDATLRNTYVDGLGVMGKSCPPAAIRRELPDQGVADFEIWQTIPLEGVDTPLKGTGTIEMKHSPNGIGRGAEGDATITAELDSSA
ncbi:hypothetical protein HJFPF1_05992 [Paramyrothecium foliicola]|nr:hypothetical protein HJFPF1_05992 [Paramyrothecium foliicola]